MQRNNVAEAVEDKEIIAKFDNMSDRRCDFVISSLKDRSFLYQPCSKSRSGRGKILP